MQPDRVRGPACSSTEPTFTRATPCQNGEEQELSASRSSLRLTSTETSTLPAARLADARRAPPHCSSVRTPRRRRSASGCATGTGPRSRVSSRNCSTASSRPGRPPVRRRASRTRASRRGFLGLRGLPRLVLGLLFLGASRGSGIDASFHASSTGCQRVTRISAVSPSARRRALRIDLRSPRAPAASFAA